MLPHSAAQQEEDWIQRCLLPPASSPLPHPACKHLQDKDLTPSHLPWNGCLETTGPYSKAALHHLCDCKCLNSPTEAISGLQQGGVDSAMVEKVINVALSWTALQLWNCCSLVHGLLLTPPSLLNSEVHYSVHYRRYLAFPAYELFDVAAITGVVAGTAHQAVPSGRTLQREEAYFLPFVDSTVYISLFSPELEDTTASEIPNLPHLPLLDEERLSWSAHSSSWE